MRVFPYPKFRAFDSRRRAGEDRSDPDLRFAPECSSEARQETREPVGDLQSLAVMRSFGTSIMTLVPGGTLLMIQTLPPMIESRPMIVFPPRMVAPE